MTIQIIIKKAIERLKLEGKLLTPDYYAEAFCKEVKIAKMNIEDCSQIKKLTTSLNPEFKKELNQYHISSMSELVRFLISRLNRTNQSFCSTNLESQVIFTKRVLQVVEVLHNKEAADLAKLSFKMLSDNPSTVIIDQFKQHWINFITTYDDSFLQSIGVKDKNDLQKSIQSLDLSSLSLSKTDDNYAWLNKVASFLVSSFVPSIASSMHDNIADISQKIKNNPNLLMDANIEDEIKKVIKLRIALDKKSVKEMIESLDGVLDKLSCRLIEMIESSDNSTVEIQKIKKELELYNNENENEKESEKITFKLAHKKLYTIAVALEENTKSLSSDLKEHSDEVNALSKKITKLEAELENAREESKEDFLTKLYNRRALDEFMKVKEAEYERYQHNFSVAMLDIDHFKLVNDNYGHDAGDAVLAAFAKILKREARSVDIVGRFGGEEFMIILSETDSEGGAIFAQKVRKQIQKAKFMYRGKRINITLSAGISERKKNSSLDNVVKSADENLYKAKNNGRNQVVK